MSRYKIELDPAHEAVALLGPGWTEKELGRIQGPELVYFMGQACGVPTAIKIGKSNSPTERLKLLQWGNHVRMRVWAIARAGATEFDYHDRLLRLRLRGEWFALSPSLAEHIRLLGARKADVAIDVKNWWEAKASRDMCDRFFSSQKSSGVLYGDAGKRTQTYERDKCQ